jgi:hypothetical protein
MRFVRNVLAALIFAALGVVAGRALERWRRPPTHGLAAPTPIDFADLQPRPRDLMPGLIAALRVRDEPWSYLHIPSWLAAFTVNFAVVALSRELGPLLSALGLAPSEEELAADPAAAPVNRRTEIWTAEVQPEPAPAPAPVPGFRPFAG